MEALKVTFLVKSTGERVEKFFNHPDSCHRFICKAIHSKKISLISYPTVCR